tara:strand:- start:1204 stop:1398 length:195 start_codon:yes stop_codon:yes gene_type:complete
LKKESNNNGCTFAVIIGVLLCFWGFSGMMDGHSFGDGIGSNIKALGILVVIGLAVYGLIKLNDK